MQKQVQPVDRHGLHKSAFTVDPGGKLPIGASAKRRTVLAGDCDEIDDLSEFRIGNVGEFQFVRKSGANVSKATMF